MSQKNRLPVGGRIDRRKVVTFYFNGKSCQGYEGDTVASGLLANDVHLVARSFKYHRPRGIVGAGAEEPNALLQVGDGAYSTPNLRATQVEIHEGLKVYSVNCWPSPSFDMLSVLGLFSAFFPAGFYYKTFMHPKRFWSFYERWIRKAAGFGVVNTKPDPDRYEKINAWCDVLVAGGGPAGISAALIAAQSGARVILADEQAELGGGLLKSKDKETQQWLTDSLAELVKHPEVTLLPRCTVAGYYDQNFLVMNERVTDHLKESPENQVRQRVWRVRTRQVVLATGAIERPLVFGNNDIPGVMLSSAVSTYINRYAVMPGNRAVVFTNNDLAYPVVEEFLEAGGKVEALVDPRSAPGGRWPDFLKDNGVKVFSESVVVDVTGPKRVRGVQIAQLKDGVRIPGTSKLVRCNLLIMSGGFSPAIHLHGQSGGKAKYNDTIASLVPGMAVQDERSAGAANSVFNLTDAIRDGYEAGAFAVSKAGMTPPEFSEPKRLPENSDTLETIYPLWQIPKDRKRTAAKRFVDFQNDTSADDILLAAREGYQSIEHVKRYTALGFGTDQGKLGNINGMAILAQTLNQSPADTGTTTFRPMYTPVPFGALAGMELGPQLYDPIRKTAMHEWHVSQGAEFENVGQWKRPWYYPKSGESMQQAVNRECVAVRKQVGILDASTLGKIEVYGPDATEFLNRIYTNAWNTLQVGACRYGLMLGEDGMVMDDGVSAKLADNHYYMTTTTGGAAHVLAWMEQWRQTEWPEMQVYFTSVTDQWAVISIAGPKARELLNQCTSGLDTSNSDFSFMSFREAQCAGVAARIFRVSFTGELSYEINVPANYALHVWEEVFRCGQQFGITPYGTETMHVLRAEKGFIIVGQDTDGSVTPVDLGMNWIVSKKKDFLGKRSLFRSDCIRNNRKQLVGLETEDPKFVLPEGAQLIEDKNASRFPIPMIGHVTSSYWSENLQRSIALAVVKGGRSRMGTRIFSRLISGETVPATIRSPIFYDPEGERQNV